jgi:amidohydrolase
MIADGVLENPKPTRALSMHVWSMEEVGKIGMTDGATMAAPDKFSITVKGRGTHGATPHEGLDPIVASAYIVTALQTIVTRSVNPLEPGVVTIGSIHGGSAANVIPDEVVMQGTIRAFSDEVMNTLRERIRSIVEHFGKSMGMVASVEFSGVDVPATVNDKAMAAVVRGVAKELVGEANVTSDHRTMGSEDCSYFLKAAPGAYVFVGAGNKAKGINEPHHSPRFQIDEDCLPISVALMTASAIKMLNE